MLTFGELLIPLLAVGMFWYSIIRLLLPLEMDGTVWSVAGRGLMDIQTWGGDRKSAESESELL